MHIIHVAQCLIAITHSRTFCTETREIYYPLWTIQCSVCNLLMFWLGVWFALRITRVCSWNIDKLHTKHRVDHKDLPCFCAVLNYCPYAPADWQQQEVLQLVISNLDHKELYFLSALLMVSWLESGYPCSSETAWIPYSRKIWRNSYRYFYIGEIKF